MNLASLACVLVLFLGIGSKTFAAELMACQAGLKSFPFLRPWIEKMGNFAVPIETGVAKQSLLYAMGATQAGPQALETWKTQSVTYQLEDKARFGGRVENAAVPTAGVLEVGWITSNGLPAVPASVVIKGQPSPINSIEPKPWRRFLSLLFAPEEAAYLADCSPRTCKIKFNDAERKLVTGSSAEYRLNAYGKILQDRISGYVGKGEILPYENSSTSDAERLQWQDLPIAPAFPLVPGGGYSQFWLPTGRKGFGYEWFNPEPGRHKPMTTLFSRECTTRNASGSPAAEIESTSYTVCSELAIYSNHYFDFWGRIVLFFPWCDSTIVLAYETMDIDQIKASRVAQALFGAEIRRRMGAVLETRLKNLHMIGSRP